MRFTVDQVRAVLSDADEPLPTVEVARECRTRAGLPGRVAESSEVRPALDRLAATGDVVHGCARDTDTTYSYLVPPDASGWNRYWALPDVAERRRAAVAERGLEFDLADALAVEFMKAWAAAGGPAGTASSGDGRGTPAGWPRTLPRRAAGIHDRPEIGVHLTVDQLAWLIGRLQ